MAHKIEWTEQTWNPSAGCSKVSSGCKNCYAERISNWRGNDIWGAHAQRKFIKSATKDLNKYQKQAEEKKS